MADPEDPPLHSSTVPISRLRLVLFAVVSLFLVGLASHGNFAGSGDAVHYMMISRSIAFDRDLDLANDYGDPSNLILGGSLEAERHALPGVDGRLRPVHDIGMPLLAAPYFALCYVVAESATDWIPQGLKNRLKLNKWIVLRQTLCYGMIAVTGILALRLLALMLDVGFPPGVAFLVTLLVTLSPPIATHGYVLFTEIPSALLALVAFQMLRDGVPSWPRSLVAGLLVGLLPLVHVRNIGLALGLMFLGSWWLFARARSRLAPFWIGIVALMGVRCAVNLLFWGHLFTSPHVSPAQGMGLVGLLREALMRSLGLVLDQEYGLLVQAPLFCLVPAGVLIALRRRWTVGGAALLLIAAYLGPVLHAGINRHGWQGGWSPAARFLVPVIPFVSLFVAAVVEQARRTRYALVLLALLGALQISMDAYGWQHPMSLWEEGDGHGRFLGEFVRVVDLTQAWPSFVTGHFRPVFLWGVAITWGVVSIVLSRQATPAGQLVRERAASGSP